MILAEGSAASAMTLAMSFTSFILMSRLPETPKSTPFAPSMVASRSGELTAILTALIARSCPPAMPMPTRAPPASCMMVRTSAKSMLMMPGVTTSSTMPCTAFRSTSSIASNAFMIGVSLLMTEKMRSFGTTISASTLSLSFKSASCASRARWVPSKANGLVTTAIVSAPDCLAASAMTGDAPPPVPPPMPAVMNAMSVF